MPLAVVHTRVNVGATALPVTVEAHVSNGMPRFSIVGLPETAVRESKDRVRSALLNSQFQFPAKRITINLAPADLPKEGARFDLPIAIGLLAASQQLPTASLQHYELVGELALSGALRPVTGILPLALATRDAQRYLIVPSANADEAAIPQGVCVYPAQHLLDICAHLMGKVPLSAHHYQLPLPKPDGLDIADVYGQQQAKRALTLAAAGGHSVLLIGPPGTGKTMLANRLPGLLPAMTEEEALQVAAVRSVSDGEIALQHWLRRPFRAPHHTSSAVALVGGGKPLRPGEVSLAHHGVLFLDELPEFPRLALEALREPLESQVVHLSRAACQAVFPANFQLIAAMNPCPCGQAGNPNGDCCCTQEQINRYRQRLSGPFLDRIDMHVQVSALPEGVLLDKVYSDSSATVQDNVMQAREIQLVRGGLLNKDLMGSRLEQDCQLDTTGLALLKQAMRQFNLSARSCHRVIRVARTVADLQGITQIGTDHLAEALQFREARSFSKS